jgi:murein DD-endopeptidase MepM/ murein hydrolase activator NlpD
MTHFLTRAMLIGVSAAALAACASTPQYPILEGQAAGSGPQALEMPTPKYPTRAPQGAGDGYGSDESPPAPPPPAKPSGDVQFEQLTPVRPSGTVESTPLAAPAVYSNAAYEPEATFQTVAFYAAKKPAPTSAAPARKGKAPEPKAPTSGPGAVVPIDGKPKTYTVKSGQGLDAVARELGTTRKQLAADNDLKEPYKLKPGQVLKGPASKGKAYIVQSGDTLSAIARRFNVTTAALADENDMSLKDAIRSGQKLKLPEGFKDSGAPKKPAPEPEAAPAKPRPKPAAPVESSPAPGPSQPSAPITRGPNAYPPIERGPNAYPPITRQPEPQPPVSQPPASQPPASQPEPEPEAPPPVSRPSQTKPPVVKPSGATEPPATARPPVARPPVAAPPITAPPTVVPSRPAAKPAPATPDQPRPNTTPSQPQPTKPSPPISVKPGPAPLQDDRPPVYSDADYARMAAGRFDWPVRGAVLSGYGPKAGGQRNDGLDIGASAGTPVRAAADGTVVYSGGDVPGFGVTVLIQHADGWVTVYGHLQRADVKMQQRITRGQQIGLVGSSGEAPRPQLHFEVRHSPSPKFKAKAIDPALVLPR